MRKGVPAILNANRLPIPGVQNNALLGFNGAFQINGPCHTSLRIVASDATHEREKYPWEHVSISTHNRCPNWEEMCFVKELFWDDEETVVQYHPAKSNYINRHPYCLHLWKPVLAVLPLPPTIMIG